MSELERIRADLQSCLGSCARIADSIRGVSRRLRERAALLDREALRTGKPELRRVASLFAAAASQCDHAIPALLSAEKVAKGWPDSDRSPTGASAPGEPSADSSQPVSSTGGTGGSDRSGMAFTEAGKEAVYRRNLAKFGVLTCEYCRRHVTRRPSIKGVPGRPDDAQIDHKDPKSKGGEGSPGNGAVACRKCNNEKRDKTVEEWDQELEEYLDD